MPFDSNGKWMPPGGWKKSAPPKPSIAVERVKGLLDNLAKTEPTPPIAPISQAPSLGMGDLRLLERNMPEAPPTSVIRPYNPSPAQQLKDALSRISAPIKEGAEYLAQGISSGLLLDKLAKAAFQPKPEQVPEQFRESVAQDWQNFERPAAEAKYVSPAVAQTLETVGGMAPYVLGGPIEGTVAKVAESGLAKAAPKLAATAAGKLLPKAVGTAALGAGVTAAQEAGADLLGQGQPLKESAKRIGENAAEFGVFGLAGGLVGAPVRGAVAKLFPKAMEAGGVTPALQRALIAASGGTATGATVGAVDAAINYLKNPDKYDAARAAGDVASQALFFGGLDTLFSLLHVPSAQRFRTERTTVGAKPAGFKNAIPENAWKDTQYAFLEGKRDMAKRGYVEFRPGTGLWINPKNPTGNPVYEMTKVDGWVVPKYETYRRANQIPSEIPTEVAKEEIKALPEGASTV